MSGGEIENDLIALALGYLLGSIPFGLIFTRLAGLGDVRTIGSGNIGATNVLRTGNKKIAAATLLGDLLKGTAAVLIARYLFGEMAALIAGVGAFFGHLFPMWLGFKGGKGVATFIGILLAIDWRVAALYGVVWLVIAAAFRFSSLAALIACFFAPFALFFFGKQDAALIFVLLSALVWIKHRANIGRLAAGTEPRIGAAK
jgi:acyl phosphate:glycerol-3-phosphate acyltransferase